MAESKGIFASCSTWNPGRAHIHVDSTSIEQHGPLPEDATGLLGLGQAPPSLTVFCAHARNPEVLPTPESGYECSERTREPVEDSRKSKEATV